MKKILKFWILVIMTVSCNDNLEVNIQPDEPSTYNTAEGDYYGKILEEDAAFFGLDLYNSSNPLIGIFIHGFCTLPKSFANFKLDAGTYNVEPSGDVKTCFPGAIVNGVVLSSLYNFTTNEFTLITGGSFTVSLSGTTYTIATNFTGEDYNTGKTVKDIRINYTGKINFTDESESDPGSIVKSTYTATGDPKWWPDQSDDTWNGTLEPFEEDGDVWYEISNWGNDDIEVYCDDVYGEIILDDYTKVAGNDDYDGYFRVGYMDGEDLRVLPPFDYIIDYEPDAKILDFTGTVTDGGKTYPALVGVVAYDKITGKAETLFTDMYENAKLQLTPVTSGGSAVRQSAGMEVFHHVKKSTGLGTKSYTGKTSTNIVVTPAVKSKMQVIPLKDMKLIDRSEWNSSQKKKSTVRFGKKA